MNILSLFDGISCGQIALRKLGIEIDNYFASEIDKYSIRITQKNYPNTIQLGDINNWKNWKLPKIDLIMGGSPCQGFSNAGAGLNFNDPRSKLFFRFIDVLNYYKPKYFLLENVKMKKEWMEIISTYVKHDYIEINSSLVSAQNRPRVYWTNISDNVKEPKNKNINIKDVLQDCIDDYFFLPEKNQGFIPSKAKKSKTGMIILGNIYPKKGQNGNIYSIDGKSKTISAGTGIIGNGIGSSNAPKIFVNGKLRRLTPLECERLQTIPDNYTFGVSNTQRYRMIGNSWTVDVIAYLLSYLPKDL